MLSLHAHRVMGRRMTALSLTERLAQHLARDVPQSTCEAARLHLLDWMGCVAGARDSAAGRAARAMPGREVAMRAALLGNVLEMDDVHRAALLHPGPVVWPVAIGAGAADMGVLLVAAVRGYEAMIAVGETFDAAHYAHWHNSATAGAFGAAAAAAAIAGLDADRTADAIGLAGSVTGGLWQMRHEPVLGKQWHVAHAAATGQSAAAHAACGITGPRRVLEGPQGLYAATCDRARPMRFDDGWRLHGVSFKPWGACRHAHPAIDAALELARSDRLGGDVLVETYADALTFCDRPRPASAIEAKFSIQHAVAIVATRGEPKLADFEDETIAALGEARSRVTVREDRAFTEAYPGHFGARVTASGASVALADARGDPERPLSREGVIAKARALMAWGGLSEEAVDRGVTAALDGDDPAAIVAWLEAIL
jgi:2-methylcitrate dehydratase PrpD